MTSKPTTGPKEPIALVWFRRDLRVNDNSALHSALETGLPVMALYIHDQQGVREIGGASAWWLHHSLHALECELGKLGSTLHIANGSTEDVLKELSTVHKIAEIYMSRSYDSDAALLEQQVHDTFASQQISVRRFAGALLFEPELIHRDNGQPYKVFTPFYKRCMSHLSPGRATATAQDGLWFSSDNPLFVSLDSLGLLPLTPDWSAGIAREWTPGEQGAQERLEEFIERGLINYKLGRDIPAEDGTSMLSPHLHYGEISPRAVWHRIEQAVDDLPHRKEGATAFLRELVWRDFAHYLLHNWPEMVDQRFRPEFNAFPWLENKAQLRAWQRGQTGYPLVDAGMRQLWQTGWMHNRVRMVVASFLVKHLLQHWQHGERWFWDTLVDADQANNTASWQWAAGSGADAAPYFRIFNPTLQSTRFDPQGDYIRCYVPELSALPAKYIHEPHKAPDDVLSEAGVALGETYPHPIVDHKAARERAMAAFRGLPKREK